MLGLLYYITSYHIICSPKALKNQGLYEPMTLVFDSSEAPAGSQQVSVKVCAACYIIV